MENKDAIEMLRSKMDGSVDTSHEWCETIRLAINALEIVGEIQDNSSVVYSACSGGSCKPCKPTFPECKFCEYAYKKNGGNI